jgi:hypothetical protein
MDHGHKDQPCISWNSACNPGPEGSTSGWNHAANRKEKICCLLQHKTSYIQIIRVVKGMNGTPHIIWFFCISNRWHANDLNGKGLKLISTFIQTATMELVVRKTFLRDVATPCLSSGHRTLWARRTWWLSMPQSICLETLSSPIISLVIDLFMSIYVVAIDIYCASTLIWIRLNVFYIFDKDFHNGNSLILYIDFYGIQFNGWGTSI